VSLLLAVDAVGPAGDAVTAGKVEASESEGGTPLGLETSAFWSLLVLSPLPLLLAVDTSGPTGSSGAIGKLVASESVGTPLGRESSTLWSLLLLLLAISEAVDAEVTSGAAASTGEEAPEPTETTSGLETSIS